MRKQHHADAFVRRRTEVYRCRRGEAPQAGFRVGAVQEGMRLVEGPRAMWGST